MIKDVNVTITRETPTLSQAGFGLPLILATNAELAYKEYIDMTQVAADYASATEANKMAAAIFAQSPAVEKIAILGVLFEVEDLPAVLTDALNTLVETKNDWYFLLCQEQDDDIITALSAWVDTKKKLYVAATNSLDLSVTLESDRTAIIYHTTPESYPDCAWVGKCAPQNPGSITWKFKTLTGITAVDITSSDIAELHAGHGNTYVQKYGINQTSEGFVTSGEYIDIIRGQDYIEAAMTERVSKTLFSQPKVPYSNAGIGLIVSDVVTVLNQAATLGIIAKDDSGNGLYTVTAPTRQTADPDDIASRKLVDVKWTAILEGAIHDIEIRGTLTY